MTRHLACLILLWALTATAANAADKTDHTTTLRLAILNDTHVSPGNHNADALRRAVAEINTLPIDRVIVNGDLTNEGRDDELCEVRAILDNLNVPLSAVPGNHENNWSESATTTFATLFGDDRFVFEHGDIVGIGTNCGPYMKMGDGHVRADDLHWLAKTLDDAAKHGKRILSFNHYPLRQDDLDNWKEYTALLCRYPVMTHINGHYHRWIPYQAADLDCIMTRALSLDGTYGYTIVEITPEWIHIYEKELDKEPRPKYAMAVRTNHNVPNDFLSSPGWENPEGFRIERLVADSASVYTRLAVDKNNIYYANSAGTLRAIDKNTGHTRWQTETGAPVFARPVVLPENKVAFPLVKTAANPHGAIIIADTRTGQTLDSLTHAKGPYVADGLCNDNAWYQGGYRRFERIDPRTTKIMWTYDTIDSYCQAAPAVTDDIVVFGAWDSYLRCLDAQTGTLRWKWNNGKNAAMLGPGNVVPVITNDKVFIVAPDRFMTAIDRTTGRQIWRDNSHKYREAIGASEDQSRIYAKTMDGELVAVNAHAPHYDEIFTVDLGLGYEHAPCIVVEKDGVVYLGSRRGILTAVDPNTQQILWSLPLGTSEINGIDTDPYTNSIYTSLVEGTIYKISPTK